MWIVSEVELNLSISLTKCNFEADVLLILGLKFVAPLQFGFSGLLNLVSMQQYCSLLK